MKEIQITLNEEQLDCLTNALEQRLGYVDSQLNVRGGSKEYYEYFKQDKKLITEIFNLIENQ